MEKLNLLKKWTVIKNKRTVYVYHRIDKTKDFYENIDIFNLGLYSVNELQVEKNNLYILTKIIPDGNIDNFINRLVYEGLNFVKSADIEIRC